MSSNDILACRAEPIIFLDYLATGKIHKDRQKIFLRGVLEGCRQAGCSLVGGETAEMPGFYAAGRMDVAGFCVGVKDAKALVHPVQAGDEIWGLPSNGFHSNGYSLIRKIISDRRLDLNDREEGEKLLEYMLRPTRIYSKEVVPLFSNPDFKACAHITGGGVVENLPRIFSNEFVARLEKKKFFSSGWMKKFVEWSGMSEREAFSTWNMGIGFCAIVGHSLWSRLEAQGWIRLGQIEQRKSREQNEVELV